MADDNPALLKLASQVLLMEGYQVLEANGGTEALDVAARHDKPSRTKAAGESASAGKVPIVPRIASK